MNLVFESTSRATRTCYATEALTQYLDENDDYLLAKDVLEEFTQSNDEAILILAVEVARRREVYNKP